MMAKFRVTAPDGSVHEVTAPDTATDQEVMDYARSNFQASAPPSLVGVDDPANAAYGEKLKLMDQARRYAATPPSPARAFNRGLIDTGEGIGQLANEAESWLGLQSPDVAKAFTEKANTGRASYQQNFGDIDPQAMRTIGSVAPTLAIPIGAPATLGGIALRGAGIGGLLGTAQFQPDNATESTGGQLLNRAGSTVGGALLGGGIPLAIGGAGKLGAKIYNAVKGNVSDPAAQELMKLSDQYGVRLQYPDISGKGQKVGTALENIPLVGTKGQRELGHAEARAAAENFTLNATGGKTHTELSQIAKDSMLLKAENAKKVKNNLYANVAKEADPYGDLGSSSALKTIDDIMKSESKQVVPDSGLLGYLDSVKKNLQNGEPNTFSRLTNFQDEIQGKVSDYYKGNNAIFGQAGVVPMQKLKVALDADIERGLSDIGKPKIVSVQSQGDAADWNDLMNFANTFKEKAKKGARPKAPVISAADEKAAMQSELYGDQVDWMKNIQGQPVYKDKANSYKLLEKWKNADKFYAEKISPYREDVATIKNITDPDQLYRKFQTLTKAKPSSVYNALPPDGRKAIQGSIVSDAMKDSLAESGEKFSEARFAQSLEKRQKDVGVFFRGKDKAEIDGFTVLMRHAQQHGFSDANPINGSRLVGWVAGIGAGIAGAQNLAIPATIGAGAYGARLLFTTNAGKRLLLASSKFPPGSAQLQRVVQHYAPMISAELATQAKKDAPRETMTIPTTSAGAR